MRRVNHYGVCSLTIVVLLQSLAGGSGYKVPASCLEGREIQSRLGRGIKSPGISYTIRLKLLVEHSYIAKHRTFDLAIKMLVLRIMMGWSIKDIVYRQVMYKQV